MQIKTTKRYYLTPVRMTIIKKSANNNCWQRYGERRTLVWLLVEMQISAAMMENNMNVLQKTKNTTATQSSSSTPFHISKENESINSKR